MNTTHYLFFYLTLQIAFSIGFLLLNGIFKLPLLGGSLTATEKLKLSRYTFVAIPFVVITVAFLVPNIHFLSHHQTNIWQPLLKQYNAISNIHSMNVSSTLLPSTTNHYKNFPLNKIFLVLLAISFIYFAKNYIASLIYLKKLSPITSNKKLQIIQSKKVNTPFCWSWLNHAFVILPTDSCNQKISLLHELQHIRQRDPLWLHLSMFYKIFFGFNPVIHIWTNQLTELQEHACDEAIIIRKQISPLAYGECLLSFAKNISINQHLLPTAIGITSTAKTFLLKRRINMLFHYQKRQAKHNTALTIASLFLASSVSFSAFALQDNSLPPLSIKQLVQVREANDTNNELQLMITPAVAAKINQIRSDADERTKMQAGIQRMQQNQALVSELIKQAGLPDDLRAVPLNESYYQALPANQNAMQSAGMWQMIPQTAINYGLTVNAQRDDRLDTKLETQAALKYLTALHQQFNNWSLALLAYNIGEKQVAQLIAENHTTDAWRLIDAPNMPAEGKEYLIRTTAAELIMHDPKLVS